jgi:hypothetical protein
MVGVREFGPVRPSNSSICRKSAYRNEGIALTLLEAEDRVGYFAALERLTNRTARPDAR